MFGVNYRIVHWRGLASCVRVLNRRCGRACAAQRRCLLMRVMPRLLQLDCGRAPMHYDDTYCMACGWHAGDICGTYAIVVGRGVVLPTKTALSHTQWLRVTIGRPNNGCGYHASCQFVSLGREYKVWPTTLVCGWCTIVKASVEPRGAGSGG